MQKAASLAGYFLNLGIKEWKSKVVHMTKSRIIFDIMGVIFKVGDDINDLLVSFV